MNRPRILFLAPHFDDFEFGCGAWFQQIKDTAYTEVCVLTDGDYRRSDGEFVYATTRREEAEVAFSILGVKDWQVLDVLEENQGYTANYGQAVAQISNVISAGAFTHVYTALPSFNQDHRFLFDAVMTAFRPAMLPNVQELWAYEYPGTCWGVAPPETGRSYRQVTDRQARRKIEALNAHKSQFEGRSVGVCPRAAEVLMQQRGAEVGLPLAECYYLLRGRHAC